MTRGEDVIKDIRFSHIKDNCSDSNVSRSLGLKIAFDSLPLPLWRLPSENVPTTPQTYGASLSDSQWLSQK